MALTHLEIEERVDFAADCLLHIQHHSEQVRAICSKFMIEWRQATRYLAHARKRILEASRRSREEFLAESIAFYEAICRNPLHKVSDRIQARKQLDRAIGIGVGVLVPVPVPAEQMDNLDLAAIAQAAREVRASRQPRIVDKPVMPEEVEA